MSVDAWLGIWESTRQQLHIRSKALAACLVRFDRIKPRSCLLFRLASKLISVVVFPRFFRLRRVFLFDSPENKLSFRRLHSVLGFRFRDLAGWELHGFCAPSSGQRTISSGSRGIMSENNSGVNTSVLGNRGTEDGALLNEAEGGTNSGWWDIDEDCGDDAEPPSSTSERSRPRGVATNLNHAIGRSVTLWRIRHDQFSVRNKRGSLLGGRGGRVRGEENPYQQCRVWTVQMEGGWFLSHEEKLLSKDGDRFVELNFGVAQDTGEVLWESVQEYFRIVEPVRTTTDQGDENCVAGGRGGGWSSCCRRRWRG